MIQGRKSFYIIGLSYKKADAEVRGHFSLNTDQQKALLEKAKEDGIESLTIISTCNRTELYGFADHPYQLIKLLCHFTEGTVEEFEQVAYVLKNREAVSHLYRVGTGLDSQILGDFEIISQLRSSFKRSKQLGLLNTFMERLINSVIQASKRIKTETELSSGATSVSFAAVQFILSSTPKLSKKNILLFGTGKIGRITCENLVKHIKNDQITLINRTKDKAEKIAGKFNLDVKNYGEIESEISRSDILVVATGAQRPTISKELLYLSKPLLILDLSIPRNVDQEVAEHPMVTLIHLDELAKVTNETLDRRSGHIQPAEEIIKELEAEFTTWSENRKFAPTLLALKSKLGKFKEGEIDYHRRKINGFDEQQAELISDRLIHKITSHFANHLKQQQGATDEQLELIRQVFQLESTED